MVCGLAHSQGIQWPYDLQAASPDQNPGQDSSRTEFVSRQNYYINTFTNKDSFSIARVGPSSTVRQTALYDLNYNTFAGSRNQYFDLSGAALRTGLISPGLSLGIDWTPVLILNSNATNQAVLGSLDMGPVARMNYFHIPMVMRGGYAGKRWGDSVAPGTIPLGSGARLLADNGYYGAFEIGSFSAPLPYGPLFASVHGYGRNMETSKLIAGVGSALIAQGFPTGDSLFLAYNDSLVDGRDASLSEAEAGKSRYINNSRRIERSFQASGGIKGKYRLFLQPALTYSFSRYSIRFPSNGILTGDRRATDNAVTMMLRTDTTLRINYHGGLRIDWEREEKLGGENIIMKVNSDSSNIDSLNVKINDYNGYKATMDHSVSVYSPGGIGFQYTFSISRYAQTYPLYYMKNSERVQNYNDNDWIVQSHHLDATVFSHRSRKITISGDYSSNVRYYLDSARSADNATDQLYRLGLSLSGNPASTVRLEEDAQIEAKQTTYEFPFVQARSQNYPPYSRRFTSKLSLNWNYSNRDTLLAQWSEMYSDQGYWYNSDYRDKSDTMPFTAGNYYAILGKTWDHGITLEAVHSMNERLTLAAGSSLRNIYELEFKSRRYIPNQSMIKYVMTPFIRLTSAMNDNMRVQVAVRRYIDTITDDYWDFTIFLVTSF
jgi:hypothetical protein